MTETALTLLYCPCPDGVVANGLERTFLKEGLIG